MLSLCKINININDMKKIKIDKFADANNWNKWVGKKIEKHSNKPFKSGLKIGIPKQYGENPYTGKPAFLMLDDETWVDCFQCKLIEIKQ